MSFRDGSRPGRSGACSSFNSRVLGSAEFGVQLSLPLAGSTWLRRGSNAEACSYGRSSGLESLLVVEGVSRGMSHQTALSSVDSVPASFPQSSVGQSMLLADMDVSKRPDVWSQVNSARLAFGSSRAMLRYASIWTTLFDAVTVCRRRLSHAARGLVLAAAKPTVGILSWGSPSKPSGPLTLESQLRRHRLASNRPTHCRPA